jgi:MOSC domain-containing protein
MVTVSELHVYPLKSCAGIRVTAVTVDAYGFAHDREFMLVDADDQLITQRTAPTLVHLQPKLDATTLRLSTPGFQEISVPLYNSMNGNTELRQVVAVFQDKVCADDMGDEAAAWFSEFLRQPVRLVRRGAAFVRTARKGLVAGQNAPIAFPDAYPFHLVSEETVAELNGRLAVPVPINRFRPNIVIRGISAPHLEDGWEKITIGNVVFRHGEPCGRCSVTTVDQTTGAVGKEPLKTLATYRRSAKGNVHFGVYLMSEQPSGEVQIGDAIRAA